LISVKGSFLINFDLIDRVQSLPYKTISISEI